MSGATVDATFGAGPVRSVNILVPASWYEFDIHPATRDAAIREAVNARVQERPELAEARTALIRTLSRVAEEAWNGGVLYFGALAEVDDEAPLIASLTIAVVDAEGGGGRAGSLAPIMAALTRIPPGRRPTDPWRRVRPVELPDAGPAARSEGIEDIELQDDRRPVRMVLMQTFVPFPAGDPRVAVISATTSQLALAEPMLELFDSITATFRFL